MLLLGVNDGITGLTAGKDFDFDFLVPLGVDSVFDFLGVDFVLGVDADILVFVYNLRNTVSKVRNTV